MKPCVYLVGAGPGDPGLITVKALELIKDAEAVVYDYLSTPFLLKHVRKRNKNKKEATRLDFMNIQTKKKV